MYKIYINETPLLLVNEATGKEKLPGNEKDLVARYTGKAKIFLNYADMLEKSQRYNSITIYSDDVEKMFSDFKSKYKVHEAAGGLIFNDKGEVLVIYRRGFWDLAKGKIDPGETKEEAAIREVWEETGLEKVELGSFLCNTFHTYRSRSEKRVLKWTHWFIMTTSQTDLKLQHEEDIEKGEWVQITDFLKSKHKIYKNIIYVLEAGLKKLSS